MFSIAHVLCGDGNKICCLQQPVVQHAASDVIVFANVIGFDRDIHVSRRLIDGEECLLLETDLLTCVHEL